MKIRFGILQKLILGFLIPVVFIVILGIISYSKSSEGLISNYNNATANTMNMATRYLEYALEGIDSISKQYAKDSDTVYFTRGLIYTNSQERLSFVTATNNELLTKTDLEKFIQNIHIIPKSNIPVLTSDMENVSGFYEELMKEEEGQKLDDEETSEYWIGEHPFIDKEISLDSSEYAFSFVRKLEEDSGCIVIDVSQEEVENFLKELEFGDNSIVGLVTADGKEIVVNPADSEKEEGEETAPSSNEEDKAEVFQFGTKDFYQESIKSAESTGIKYITYDGAEYLYVYSKIDDTGITLCGLVPKTSFMKQAKEIGFSTIIIVILACLVAIVIGTKLSTGIGRTMKKINRQLNQIAKGDLAVELNVKRKDEFGLLAVNIMEMLNNMKHLIEKVVYVSSLVSDSAGHVIDVAKEITASNQNITSAVYEIGEGITAQAKDSQNCLGQMDGLSEKISTVNVSLVEIESLMDEMKVKIDDSLDTMEELMKQSEATNQITKYVVNNITLLEEKTKSIEAIVQVINDIADQTNLLSLNASIEAARAGEAGKGFAVVAAEIRNLASKALTSADAIRIVIDDITKQTKDTVLTAGEAENIVSAQNKVVENTMEAFRIMNTGIEKLISNLLAIGYNIKNMESSKEVTLGAVENISAVSQQTLAASGNIGRSVENQADSMGILEKEAKILNENASDLKKVVSVFRL